MKRTKKKLLGAAVISLLFSIVSALPSFAIVYSEGTIDGHLPTESGLNCSADATTMRSVYLKDMWGANVGFLELRYSLTCHAAWARLTNYYTAVGGDTHSGQAWITRTASPTGSLPTYTCSTSPGTFQSCYTRMVYDLDPRTAKASASIDAYDSYYGTITGQTSSY